MNRMLDESARRMFQETFQEMERLFWPTNRQAEPAIQQVCAHEPSKCDCDVTEESDLEKLENEVHNTLDTWGTRDLIALESAAKKLIEKRNCLPPKNEKPIPFLYTPGDVVSIRNIFTTLAETGDTDSDKIRNLVLDGFQKLSTYVKKEKMENRFLFYLKNIGRMGEILETSVMNGVRCYRVRFFEDPEKTSTVVVEGLLQKHTYKRTWETYEVCEQEDNDKS